MALDQALTAPIVGARPGEPIVSRTGYVWRVYEFRPGELVAAVYLAGRLLRRDMRGWWVAGYLGDRVPIDGDPVARLGPTVPDGWPVHPEQVDLAGGGADE